MKTLSTSNAGSIFQLWHSGRSGHHQHCWSEGPSILGQLPSPLQLGDHVDLAQYGKELRQLP